MTPDTTQALIEEVKRRAGELKAAREKATPGPWSPCLGSGHHECTAIHFDGDERHPYGLFVADLLPDYMLDEKYKDDVSFKERNMDFITHAANESIPLADLALRLARVVECLDGALERYEHEIPSNRPITEDSAKYEREYGLGRKARQAREQARKIACGEE